MSFKLYDEDGYVGDFGTNTGTVNYLSYLKGMDIPELEVFIDKGVDIIPEAILEAVSEVSVPNGDLRSTHDNFVELLKKCNGIVILSDEINDDLEDLEEEA